MFGQEDTNADGVLSIAEIEAVFDKYDTNGQCMLTWNSLVIYKQIVTQTYMYNVRQ